VHGGRASCEGQEKLLRRRSVPIPKFRSRRSPRRGRRGEKAGGGRVKAEELKEEDVAEAARRAVRDAPPISGHRLDGLFLTEL